MFVQSSFNIRSKDKNDLLATLVMKYHKKLTAKAASIVGEVYAEEIVQDVWESLAKGDVCLDDIDSISSWLHRVVINRSLNRNKREIRSISLEHINPQLSTELNTGRLYELTFSEETPEQTLVGDERVSALVASWDSLSHTQQRAMELRYFKDYSYVEIASELSLTLSNIKVSLHRAKSKLYSST